MAPYDRGADQAGLETARRAHGKEAAHYSTGSQPRRAWLLIVAARSG